MSKKLSWIKPLIAIIAVVLIIVFITIELRNSGIQFIDIVDNIDWDILPLAVLALSLYFFFAAVALRFLLNRDSGTQLTMKKIFGVLNISGLTKYVPGKVWSYAILFSVLNKNGVAVSKAVFDSLVHLILTVTTPVLYMLPVAAFSFLSYLELPIRIVLFIFGLGLYLFYLWLFPSFLKSIIGIINRFKKEPILYIPISRFDVIKTKAIIFTAYLFYIASVAVIVFSIDSSISIPSVLQLSITSVFSMIIGFVVIIVPGGLGVQESLVYLFAGMSQADVSFVLALPIVFRMVSIAADLIVGLLSLWLIRSDVIEMIRKKPKRQENL